MDHEFELAFTLLDEAAERIQQQQYGISRILCHSYGQIALTTVHHYTRDDGHTLVLLAADDYGQMVAVEATAADLETEPAARIRKVRAGALTFHGVAGTWGFRAKGRRHSYTLDAHIGEAGWTLRVDGAHPISYAHIDDAIAEVLAHEPLAA